MNRRIPRIALLIVLLFTMVGVFHGGAPTSPRVALAQEHEHIECGPWHPYEEVANTPPVEPEGFEVTRTYDMTEESNSNISPAKSLTEISLFEGGVIAAVSDESAIYAIDSGAVTLTVCGEGTQVGIQLPEETTPKSVGEGEYTLPANSAVFIDPEDPYFLTGLSGGEATPSGSVQQLDLELSSNALPAELTHGGSHGKYVAGQNRKLCGGAGC